ncbi:MAG TPA: ornithine carbamoyltransferase [Acidimicrobiales bacterium]|nr:ornithine carbamoyltransferase [Acidimicrobiales bacterium]
MTRHFLDVDDLSAAELGRVLDLAGAYASGDAVGQPLRGRGAALVFEKPSARTRSSTELAVAALGGHPVYIQGPEVGIDSRETAEDVARTLACYHAVICARVLDHGVLVRMAGALDEVASTGVGGHPGGVPVVNLLSDLAHPCQALADLLTLRQEFGELAGRTLTFVGDANNVWRSLAIACTMAGMRSRLAAPEGYGPSPDDLARLARLGAQIEVGTDPAAAVAGADAVYTDVWTSMGQEEEAARRLEDFAGFTVDESLLEVAGGDAVFLHCLPAHRGEEVTDAVLEGGRSRVWRQAANREHAVRGLLAWLLTEGSERSGARP